MNAFSIVEDFENEVACYTQAPYCVAVNSCTNALFLSLMWQCKTKILEEVEIPKYTYVSVPMQIKHCGLKIKFRDEEWKGVYELKPTQIWDSA